MYIQGVSTRRVSKIVEQLCGFEVSVSQVSDATKLLDEEIEKWRERALGVVFLSSRVMAVAILLSFALAFGAVIIKRRMPISQTR